MKVFMLIAAGLLLADANANDLTLYGGICQDEANCNEQSQIEVIAKCKAHGVTVMMPSLSADGRVLWKTDKLDYLPTMQANLDKGYDALAVFIKHAHAAGLKVIPSIAVGPGGRILKEHPEWETRDRQGRPSSATVFTCIAYSYPAARAAKIAALMDLVNDYDVDGVLLDYCRYPEHTTTPETAYGYYGYDEPLLKACRQIYGFDPRQEPVDSANWKIFNAMRAESVTTFVREFREAIQRSGRKIRLCAFGDGDSGPEMEARSCGRDYGTWCRRGLIDDFFMANYTTPIPKMTEVVQRVRQAISPTVVLHSSLTPFQHFQKTNDEMVAAGKAQLAGGADGLWIYREDFLEQLNLWAGAKSARDLLIATRSKP